MYVNVCARRSSEVKLAKARQGRVYGAEAATMCSSRRFNVRVLYIRTQFASSILIQTAINIKLHRIADSRHCLRVYFICSQYRHRVSMLTVITVNNLFTCEHDDID